MLHWSKRSDQCYAHVISESGRRKKDEGRRRKKKKEEEGRGKEEARKRQGRGKANQREQYWTLNGPGSWHVSHWNSQDIPVHPVVPIVVPCFYVLYEGLGPESTPRGCEDASKLYKAAVVMRSERQIIWVCRRCRTVVSNADATNRAERATMIRERMFDDSNFCSGWDLPLESPALRLRDQLREGNEGNR